MSVRGEFQRVLAAYLDLLRRHAGTAALADSLEEASQGADLAAGAERALRWLEAEPPTRLVPESQRGELARRGEHLAAICRVILGR